MNVAVWTLQEPVESNVEIKCIFRLKFKSKKNTSYRYKVVHN